MTMNNILPSDNPSQSKPSLSSNPALDTTVSATPSSPVPPVDPPSADSISDSAGGQPQPPQAAETTTADLALTLDAVDPCPPVSPPAVVTPQSAHQDAPQDTVADPASYYWDATTMAPLNAASAAAIARLRAYRPPPFPTWDSLPASRRAAVLILLFADRFGDLRVVITMRAASLRSFSGHAAFPGGKADSAAETPYQIARREAWEEIGLPMDDTRLPKPFRIEPLTCLPCSLAKTELVVRPCVAYLHPDRKTSSKNGDDATVQGNNDSQKATTTTTTTTATADESMIPKLDAKEVAAVFSAPLYNFLKAQDQPRRPGEPPLPPGQWYDGYWHHWHETAWRVHNFRVPINNQRVSKPKRDLPQPPNPESTMAGATPTPPPPGTIAVAQAQKAEEKKAAASAAAAAASNDSASASSSSDDDPQRFLVWGLTGRMLVDAARVAYGEEPEFEHNDSYGDEELIAPLADAGRLPHIEKKKNNRGTTTTTTTTNTGTSSSSSSSSSSAAAVGEKRKLAVDEENSGATEEEEATAATTTRVTKDAKI